MELFLVTNRNCHLEPTQLNPLFGAVVEAMGLGGMVGDIMIRPLPDQGLAEEHQGESEADLPDLFPLSHGLKSLPVCIDALNQIRRQTGPIQDTGLTIHLDATMAEKVSNMVEHCANDLGDRDHFGGLEAWGLGPQEREEAELFTGMLEGAQHLNSVFTEHYKRIRENEAQTPEIKYTRVLIEHPDGFVEKVWAEIQTGDAENGTGLLANQPMEGDLKMGQIIAYETKDPDQWPWLV